MQKIKRYWGWYRTLVKLPCFRVKILRFNEGARLSTQKHWYRNELWLFLSGYGAAYSKPHMREARRFSCMWVPRKTMHSYLCIHPTTVIELQWGRCVDERDIYRVKGSYNDNNTN